MHLPPCSQRGLSKMQTWSNCAHGKKFTVSSLFLSRYGTDSSPRHTMPWPDYLPASSSATPEELSRLERFNSLHFPSALSPPGLHFRSPDIYSAPTRCQAPAGCKSSSSGREYQYNPTPNISLPNSYWAFRSHLTQHFWEAFPDHLYLWVQCPS